MIKITKGIVAAIAGILIIALTLTLAVDTGLSLYDPGRYAHADSYCKLTVFSGTIEVQTPDNIAWKEAASGMLLEPNTRVRTRAGSYSLLTFGDGTTTKLDPDTDVLLSRLDTGTDNRPGATLVKQRSGKSWNQVATVADGQHRFEVQTASAGVVAHGTLFLVGVDESGRTLVQTTEGQVSVAAQGHEVSILAGEQTEVIYMAD